jgi:uncharacterized membrane protein
VPAAALALVLGAAFVHAGWNVLLARAAEPRLATAVAMAFSIVVAAPLSLLDFRVEWGVWPYVAASALLETGYVLLLAYAYEAGSMSVVYPVARGSAPVVALLLTIAITTSLPSAAIAIGIGVIVAGILAVRGFGGDAAPRDVRLGAAIGCLIGGYGVTDAAGLRHAAPLPYLFLVMIVPGLVGLALALRRSGGPAVRASVDRYSLLAGIGTTAAFALSLAAFARVPTSVVPAVQAARETSVVIGVAMAAVVLGEPVGRLRAGGAALVVAGIVVIAVA